MQRWSWAFALVLAISGSALAQQCQLPDEWTEGVAAQAAITSVNNACPKALVKPDSSACVPCVCASLNLFNNALMVAQSDSGFSLYTPMGMSEASEVFNTCIQENPVQFANQIEVQKGLNDCLTSPDATIKGAKLLEFCLSWGVQHEEVKTMSSEADRKHVLSHNIDLVDLHRKEAKLASGEEEVEEVEEAVEEVQHEDVITLSSESEIVPQARNILLGEESSAEESSKEESSGEESSREESSSEESSSEESSSEESSGEIAEPPLAPGAAQPPPPSRDLIFPPPPPSPPGSSGSAATVTTANIMLQVTMALVSAVLLASMVAF